MNRRQYLKLLGAGVVTSLAGCSGGSSSDGPMTSPATTSAAATPLPTTDPATTQPSTAVVTTTPRETSRPVTTAETTTTATTTTTTHPDLLAVTGVKPTGSIQADVTIPVRITVANRGNTPRVADWMLELRAPGAEDWRAISSVKLHIQPGSENTYAVEYANQSEKTGTAEWRLVGADYRWETTITEPVQTAPTTLTRSVADAVTATPAYDAASIRETAEVVNYLSLTEDFDQHVGDAIYFKHARVFGVQFDAYPDGSDRLLLDVAGESAVEFEGEIAAKWGGQPLTEGDYLSIWAVVERLYEYRDGVKTHTIPLVSLVDLRIWDV